MKHTTSWVPKNIQTVLLIILAVALFGVLTYFLFYKLGSHPLLDWDEGIYAQVSKEALRNKQPFSFTYFGDAWLEKPPLVIWLTGIGFRIFGISELGARIAIPLFSIGIILLTCLLVWHFRRSWLAILMTLAAYFICYHFFLESFFLNFDIPITFFVLAGIYSYIRAKANPSWWYIFGASLGLGIMTKNIIGLFPLAIILIISIVNRTFTIFRTRQFYYGLLITLAVTMPWHIIETIQFGNEFWNNYLIYHVWTRFTQGIEHNGAPFWYYIAAFNQNILFLIASILSSIYILILSLKQKEIRILPVAIVLIFLMLSIAKTKGYGYIVPIYPYILTALAISLTDAIRRIPYTWLKVLTISTLLACFVVLGWQQNNYKVYKWDKEPDLLDNRSAGQLISSLNTDAKLTTTNKALIGPAFAFYSGRDIHVTTTPNSPPLSERILHQHARSIYFSPDRNQIVITP